MGNFYSTPIAPENSTTCNSTNGFSKTSVDPLYLTKLRYWERGIQWDNWNRYQNSTNIPKHMPKLKKWEKKINITNLYRRRCPLIDYSKSIS